jgi:hypothetical protein
MSRSLGSSMIGPGAGGGAAGGGAAGGGAAGGGAAGGAAGDGAVDPGDWVWARAEGADKASPATAAAILILILNFTSDKYQGPRWAVKGRARRLFLAAGREKTGGGAGGARPSFDGG